MSTTAQIALAGLAAEYCRVVEDAAETAPQTFLHEVLRYLPRLYITIADMTDGVTASDNGMIYPALDETSYESARASMAALLGEYDTYLDTQVDDMMYSDTPVAVSLSERLADIYQAMYDLADNLRQVPDAAAGELMENLADNFETYLSDTLSDALRAANRLYYSRHLDNDPDI